MTKKMTKFKNQNKVPFNAWKIIDCYNCDGKGYIDYDLGEENPYSCGSCNGAGKELQKKTKWEIENE